MRKRHYILALLLAIGACGGGGSSGGGGGGTPPTGPSVSGDMLAFTPMRGWNYQGNGFGLSAVTLSIYADPQQNGVDPLIFFATPGFSPDAFSGQKLGGIGVVNSGSGYDAVSYVLLNADGSIYAEGAITPVALFVPSTLTQGQSFIPYPGATATVQSVGSVPGSGPCPQPAQGATVQYSFLGQNYTFSFVPGCGITQYIGNNGEHFTLVSIGTYQLGTQSVPRMGKLTALDTLKSLTNILVHHAKWAPFHRAK
ncbi:MAG: hypothetical protein JO233_06865 [Candidatus Eremiobacteraeota bacterium]|nr:hypothetical protein [Candidatus Eremiobacteraeota bacterium]